MLNETGLCGVGIKGYRCFPEGEYAKFGPFRKIQLLTGQNNSGKSTLMHASVKLLSAILPNGVISGEKLDIALEDLHAGDDGFKELCFSLCFDWESLLLPESEAGIPEKCVRSLIELLKCASEENSTGKYVWFDCRVKLGSTFRSSCHDIQFLAPSNFNDQAALGDLEALAIWYKNGKLLYPSTNQEALNWFSDIAKHIIPWDRIPSPETIQAIRHVNNKSVPGEFAISRGNGLIRELHKLSNPNPATQKEADRKWNRFSSFIRHVLGDDSAEIKVDADETVVMVKTEGSPFYALDDLGTGIEELVMLAAAVAVSNNKLICVEEPELHLHPALQADLISHLNEDDAGNRFLITTHSATLVNSGLVEVAQVIKDGAASHATPVRSLIDSRRVVDDLGVRPADLLMSNYVIWVEGPSDRTYVKYWISLIDPSLQEGRHYSIMFYGGKLLSHLNVDSDGGADGFIKLIYINTHCCVIMDSDRKKKYGKINETKLRIQRECESSGSFVWVTDHYTIENYVPEELLADALRQLYPKKVWSNPLNDPYRGPLSGCFDDSKTMPDKNAVADWVTSNGFEMGEELNKKVTKLVNEIKRASGMR